MVFASVDFLFLFLPVFLLVQNFLPYRNVSYVLFSLLFYFIGEGWYTSVIIASVTGNYLFGIAIGVWLGRTGRKVALALGIGANLGALIYFKYAGFFAANLLDGALESRVSAHLPLGISFFTFHAISYLVDVYRLDAEAERSFVRLALYILMFPQLIAGPILRFHTVAPQLRERTVTTENVYHGLVLFCLGMGQKVLLADTLAGICDPLFAKWQSLSAAAAWLAAISYSLQLYFDFSGYSNMAIGLGWLSGFYFPMNFNYPYISRSITEFWRRWHISLSRWFRDYLYIPLGGNRHGAVQTYRNLIVVFVLCGFWHGAAWTFLAWGAYHGALLVVERLGLGAALERVPAPFRHLYALFAILVGWVIFRAEDLTQAAGILRKMMFAEGAAADAFTPVLTGEETVVLSIGVVLATPLVANLMRPWVAVPDHPPWPPRSPWAYGWGLALGGVVLCAAATKILTGSYSPFIYFRF
jgi:alginate O-acetyltransferase complex protein AlgI